MIKFYILIFLCFMATESVPVQVPFASFTGTYPASRIDIGQLSVGTHLKITLSCVQPIEGSSLYLLYGNDLKSSMTRVISSTKLDLYTAVIDRDITIAQHYWSFINGAVFYMECQTKVEINGVLSQIRNHTLFYSSVNPVHKISVSDVCRVGLIYTGEPLTSIAVYNTAGLKSIANYLTLLTTPPYYFNIPANGDYYFVLQRTTPPPSLN